MQISTSLLRSAFLAALITVSSFGLAQAQTTPPAWSWANAVTSTANTFMAGFAMDAAGNTYIAGTVIDPVTVAPGTVLTAQAGTDAYVAKYNITGSLLWVRQVSGGGNERIARMVTDAAGNVYLTGSYSGGNLQVGTLGLPPLAFPSSYMASLDPQGQPRWVREVRSIGANVSNLGVDAAGNLYVSGSFSNTTTVGGIALNTPNTVSLFLAKFDASGTIQWAQAGGSVPFVNNTVANQAHSLTVSPAGDVYLIWGIHPGAGGFGSVPPAPGYGDYDVSVVRYNTQGVAQWQKRFGTAFSDRAGAAALDGGGHLLVPMTFSSNGPATVGSQPLTGTGQNFSALLQLDTGTGNLQWAQKLEASGNVFFQSVAVDDAGNSYVAGSLAGTAQAGGQQLSSNGSATDALVASYTSTGTPRWFQKSGSALEESANFIALNSSNELSVGGYFYQQGQFASISLTSGGGPTTPNIFVARLGTGVATAAQAAQTLLQGLYPNPATTVVYLPGLPAGTRVQLVNALGRIVRETAVSEATQVSVLGLAPGLYTLRAMDAKGRRYAARLAVN